MESVRNPCGIRGMSGVCILLDPNEAYVVSLPTDFGTRQAPLAIIHRCQGHRTHGTDGRDGTGGGPLEPKDIIGYQG